MSEDALMKLGKAMIEEELVRISPVKYVQNICQFTKSILGKHFYLNRKVELKVNVLSREVGEV